MRRSLLALLAALSVAAPARAAKLASGEVLSLGTDARSLGMAESYLAQARGEVGSLLQSPLGLHGLDTGAMAYGHSFLIENLAVNTFAYGRRLGDWSFGFALLHLDYGSIDERDSAGTRLGTFAPRDVVLQVSGARKFGDWETGVSLKRLDSKIVKSATAVAFDAAVRRPIAEDVALAVAVRNVGQELEFETEGAPLPAEAAVGLSWAATPALRWNVAATKPAHADLWVATGGQFDLAVKDDLKLALRAGANTRTPELGGLSGLHAGFGIEAGRLAVDYSFDPFGDIGTNHNVGVRYRW